MKKINREEAERNRLLLESMLDEDGYLPNGNRLDGAPPSFKKILAFSSERKKQVDAAVHDMYFGNDAAKVTHDMIYAAGMQYRLPMQIVVDEERLPGCILLAPMHIRPEETIDLIRRRLRKKAR